MDEERPAKTLSACSWGARAAQSCALVLMATSSARRPSVRVYKL